MTEPYLKIHRPENEHLLKFWDRGKEVISIDMRNGRVTVAEGYTYDDAAKCFWEAVEQAYGRVRNDVSI